MVIQYGQELEDYKKNALQINPNWTPRDFTKRTRRYFESQTEKILAIGGLLGTGKTVGALQSADGLDITYILAQKEEKETGKDYIEAIKNAKSKNIIIDEYSWIQNRRCLDEYLLTAVQNGKRIAITGTESITLDFLNYGSLIHRVDMIHTTMFPYEEYRNVYGLPHNQKTCDDYLVKGGVFEVYAITNFGTMQTYIENAIIDNLAGYMRNEISDEEAKTLTYAVLYKAVCPSNLSRVSTLRNNHVTLDSFLDTMGINTEISINGHHLNRVSEIFEQTGIIIKVPNYDTTSPLKEQYYITNPSLSCQLIKAAYNLDTISRDILGHAFEASAMVQLATNKLSGHEIYFINNEGQSSAKELDIVITDRECEHAYFFECKHMQKHELDPSATILSSYIEEKYFSATDIAGRYVIYNGEPCVNEYGVGKIMFTPLNETINNYFNFDENIKGLKKNIRHSHDINDIDSNDPGTTKTVDIARSIADKVKELKLMLNL